MTQQAPGTYTGADGREYRWEKGDGYYHTQADNHTRVRDIAPVDWPAARAALDALVEQESGEWVEIGEPQGLREGQRRIRRDGSQPQTKSKPYYGEEKWVDLTTSAYWVDAYRKGREVGIEDERKRLNEEADKATVADGVMYQSGWNAGREWEAREDKGLRDAARELVEVVKDMPTFNQVDCWDWLKAVKAAAKALEGKL